MVDIRRATAADRKSLWPLFQPVVAEGDIFVAEGDIFVYAPDTSEEQAYSPWISSDVSAYMAVEGGGVVGTYLLKPN